MKYEEEEEEEVQANCKLQTYIKLFVQASRSVHLFAAYGSANACVDKQFTLEIILIMTHLTHLIHLIHWDIPR